MGPLRIVLTVIFFLLAAFFALEFLLALEGGAKLAWRVGYAAAWVVCVAALLRLLLPRSS